MWSGWWGRCGKCWVLPNLVRSIQMAWYQCRIRGENFPGILLGKKEPIGFYTTRVVEAESPQDAEVKALAELKGDKSLDVPKIMKRGEARVFLRRFLSCVGAPFVNREALHSSAMVSPRSEPRGERANPSILRIQVPGFVPHPSLRNPGRSVRSLIFNASSPALIPCIPDNHPS